MSLGAAATISTRSKLLGLFRYLPVSWGTSLGYGKLRLECRRRGLGVAIGIFVAIIAACGVRPAAAQNDSLFLRNRANPTVFLSVAAGFPVAASIDVSALNAQWVLEPVPDEPLVRIRNREQNTYLHTQQGVLELSDVDPFWVSAMWQVEPVEGTTVARIRNAATGLYLALQEVTGPLGVAPLDPTGGQQDPNSPPVGAPPPGQPSDRAPATVEWEFIRVEGIPPGTEPPAAPPLPPQGFAPPLPESCTGGMIWYRGGCRCPINSVLVDGFCLPPPYECIGGDIYGRQCYCPGGRVPIVTGPRELSCLYAGTPPCPSGTMRVRGGACVPIECPPGEYFSVNRFRCVAVVRVWCAGGSIQGDNCFCPPGTNRLGNFPNFSRYRPTCERHGLISCIF